MRIKAKLLICSFVLGFSLPLSVQAARIKDIADVEGVRGNDLFGFGVVVGLNG
ncbi:MAG: flagellar basal body P-ring protein FlgI, partial [Bdellovibrionales bacterium]|nr:flagellar basal body P-ring protein FlgI [Bdellovibrionales bacterium]